MTDKIDDGGPAFPSQQSETQDGSWNQTYESGMSLRDWFAGQAPPAPDLYSISLPNMDDLDGEGIAKAWVEWQVNRAVSWSWDYADAMLAARAKGGAK